MSRSVISQNSPLPSSVITLTVLAGLHGSVRSGKKWLILPVFISTRFSALIRTCPDRTFRVFKNAEDHVSQGGVISSDTELSVLNTIKPVHSKFSPTPYKSFPILKDTGCGWFCITMIEQKVIKTETGRINLRIKYFLTRCFRINK